MENAQTLEDFYDDEETSLYLEIEDNPQIVPLVEGLLKLKHLNGAGILCEYPTTPQIVEVVAAFNATCRFLKNGGNKRVDRKAA